MKKVARLRIAQDENSTSPTDSQASAVRTTGRIKKPKAVFDPSDNYLPRAHRVSGSASSMTIAGAVERNKRDSQPTQQEPQGGKRLSQSSSTSLGTTNTTLSDASEVCFVCLKREAKRGASAKNKLVACQECEKRVHKFCLKVEFEDFDLLRQKYKCENCRTCELCAAFADVDTKSDQELVTCAKCVKSYHLTCHIPSVQKFQQFQKNWKCNKCTLPTLGNGNILPVKTIREIIGDEPPKTVKATQVETLQQPHQQEREKQLAEQKQLQQQQQQQEQLQQNVNIAAAAAEAKTAAVKRTQEERKLATAASATTTTTTILQYNGDEADELELPKKKKHNMHQSTTAIVAATSNAVGSAMRYSPNEPIDLPDVKHWSVEQVYNFFARYFPKEAFVFREHEIDGMSLLLLKRSDVIKKLPIKLGPSLRMYSLILKLQTQLNDPTLGWNCGL